MKALLESGVHFGHRVNRWDPRMKPFIFTERNGIHIVDLQQTVQSLQRAYDLIRNTVAEGGTVLFVGTKRQAQETIQMEAERCDMPYVIERWMPGTLTNWTTIFARIMELERMEKMIETGEINRLVKKEQLMINREITRLLTHLSGIRHMNGLPSLVFIVDVMREDTAVHEANLREVPVVAMVDTNCNPQNVDYVIPANDDAIRAIKLIVSKVADAVLEGKAMRKEEDELTAERDVIGEDEGRTRVRGRIQLEEEINDEELLGAATLQKLADSKREEEAEVAVVAEAAVEVEAAVEDEPAVEAEPATVEADDENPFAVLKPVKKTVKKADNLDKTEEEEAAEEDDEEE
jgi:small subunit ribosomal protein S2